MAFGWSAIPVAMQGGEWRIARQHVAPDATRASIDAAANLGEDSSTSRSSAGPQPVAKMIASSGRKISVRKRVQEASTAPDRWDSARVIVRSLASGEEVTVVTGGSNARYVPTGHLIYAVGDSLLAVRFDLRRLRVDGPAFPVVNGIRRGTPSVSGAAQFAVANNGALVYVPGAPSASRGLAVTDRNGNIERLQLPPGAYEAPRVSPDGQRIAFATDEGKEASVWVYDLAGTTSPRRLTDGGNARFPTWSQDGRRVAFQFERDGDAAIFWQPLDGGTPERLTKPAAGEVHEPEAWSPTADVLVYNSRRGNDVTLWSLSLKDRAVSRFSDVRSWTRTGAVFSPDGRWLAYASSGASGPTIYVEPFPATGVKYQLPAHGAREPHHPLWSPDRKELFYTHSGDIRNTSFRRHG